MRAEAGAVEKNTVEEGWVLWENCIQLSVLLSVLAESELEGSDAQPFHLVAHIKY